MLSYRRVTALQGAL